MRIPRLSRVSRVRGTVLAVVAATVMAFPLGVLASHQFGDVPNSNIFHGDIDALVDAGVTAGCGGGNYCPNQAVTRGQMAAFMNRLGALAPGKTPVVNADRIDGLDSSAFARPMFAVVNGDGSLARGAGALSSTKFGGVAGTYQVNFNRTVSTCAYIATIGNAGTGNPSHGTIVTALRAGTTDAVFVETRDSAGALADRGFHLQVSCTAAEGAVTMGEIQDTDTDDGSN